MEIKYLNSFTDNYIWLLQHNTDIIVVDPGQAPQVLNYITANNLCLKSIWLTHNHPDHVDGMNQILERYPVPVYATFVDTDKKIANGDAFTIFDNISVQIISTPGHTYDAACFYVYDQQQYYLFCGDTLFAAGCGRVFTGDYSAMFKSLNRLRQLAFNTLIYPGHEYTIRNLQFAQYLEPKNKVLLSRLLKETHKFDNIGITLPAVLNEELLTNPFFRCDDEILLQNIEAIIGREVNPGLEAFVKMRELRNAF